MATYAGAVAAMRARFVANFTDVQIAFQNEEPPAQPWPPAHSQWVYFEVIQSQSTQRGAGLPGSQAWLTTGHIFLHVFAPLGFGLPEHLALAEKAGEVFRAQTFYSDGQGAKVLCGGPWIDGGASDADQGNQFRFTVTVPFEFYFLK